LRKLVAFFKRSRDKWKLKMANAKKELKRLENRVRFLEKSRDQWKEKARSLEAKSARLEAELGKASMRPEPELNNAVQKKANPVALN
jgi:predicted  nucleic acid-binding Zn-ribbon protein